MATKAQQLREMNDGELEAKKQDLQKTMMTYRFQKALSQLEKPIIMREVRRDYARVLTIMKERQMSGATETETTPKS